METCGSIKISQRKVADLVPYARNARTHSDAQVDQIAASIREFGWTNPILIDGAGGVIAGHGRLLAAKKLGMAKVPCIVLGHLSDEQRRALVLADNQLALTSGWDEGLLAAELKALIGEGFDVGLAGFGGDALAELLAEKTAGLTDPDDVPEVSVEPATLAGDVWVLGRHRIVCGDSTDAETVGKAMNGAAPHLMVTDPPYGVDYDANWRNERVRDDGTPIAGRAVGKVLNDNEADWRAAWALFPGSVAYVWHADLRAREAIESLESAGFLLRAQIIWAKGRFAIGRGDYHFQHEPCWYAVKKGKTGRWSGDRTQTTLWEISHSKSETGHSTQKPIECMKRPIENNSRPGDAVYEPFCGSGTTIIAGEMTGRAVHAIELNPAYVDVSVIRWQEFTGKAATLEATGQTFDEVRADRARKAAA